jgi:hypothetical protein
VHRVCESAHLSFQGLHVPLEHLHCTVHCQLICTAPVQLHCTLHCTLHWWGSLQAQALQSRLQRRPRQPRTARDLPLGEALGNEVTEVGVSDVWHERDYTGRLHRSLIVMYTLPIVPLLSRVHPREEPDTHVYRHRSAAPQRS